jgi:iron complex outermembrane receptor protein
VYSPRAALVFRPIEAQSFRISFNRAYSSPSSLNYFLDIQNGFAPELAALGFGLRAFGTGRNGWSVVNPDGTLKGFRSPFNPGGAGQTLPMGATTNFWAAAIGVLSAQVQAGALPAELGQILPVLAGLTPAPGSIGTMVFDPQSETLRPLASHGLEPMPSIQESNTESIEIGWTGIIDQRVKISADVYRSTQNDFVSPLLIQTPLVTFNGQDVGAFITVPIVTAITQQYIAAGLPPDQAQERAQQDAAVLIPQLAAGIAQVPIGVVSSPEFPGGSDLIVSYRNVGDLTLWGADLALQWFLTDTWTLNGTYSWVSDDSFDIGEIEPIALNAATHKGSIGLAYRNVHQGFNADARLRFNNSFPAISAGFEGDVPSATLVDLNLGYKIPNTRATAQLAVTNIFDSEYRSFVGVPDIGRFAILRLKYDLF